MSEQDKITIEVDGRQLEARPGQMLIEVTDAAGITVPRFCYHKKLSIAANCRMCLVEVENAPKPLPACATPVSEGMKVHTRSPLARSAQKGTMEFLLINHPLDCPICDQGGECELQDVSMGYGADISRFVEGKRAVASKDIGPLIATEMTRCIHCTRCVRFGDEIAGLRELGAVGRGEHTEIGTYIEHSLSSELSGNVIDLCPVGALTAKPSRFQARPWEMNQHAGIALHDGMGSAIYWHSRRHQIIRVVPRENEAINEVWIADRERFSYQGITAEDRIQQPLIRIDGELKPVDWQQALTAAAEALKSSQKLGALISPHASLEEMYLAQKLIRALGSDHIDHRLRRADFSAADPSCPWLGCSYEDISRNDLTFLIGSWLRKEVPLLNHRLRQSVLNGGQVLALNPVDYDFNYPLAAKQIVPPAQMLVQLAHIARLLGADDFGLAEGEAEAETQIIADKLQQAEQGSILLGFSAYAHPQYGLLRALAAAIAAKTGLKLGELGEGANQRGAYRLGLLPQNGGMNTAAMLEQGLDTCLLLGIEPEYDVLHPAALKNMLSQSTCIAISSHMSPALEAVADMVLPMAVAAETAGSYINLQGDVQSVQGAARPIGEARPAWKILRVLGNLCDLDGFDYEDADQVKQDAFGAIEAVPLSNEMESRPQGSVHAPAGIQRIIDLPIYAVDALVRRSPALQQTPDAWQGAHLSPELAQQLGIADGDLIRISVGDQSTEMTACIDARVPDQSLWLPTAVPGVESLNSELEIAVEKA